MSPVFPRGRTTKNAGLVRRASVARFGEIEPSYDSLASWGGRVLVARDDQRWPMGNGGPMVAVLQMNLAEAPYVPQIIEHVQLLTLFIGPFRLPSRGEPEQHYSIRAYRDLDTLAPLPEPIPARSGEGGSDHPTLRALPLSWHLVDEQLPEGTDQPEPELELGSESSSDEDVNGAGELANELQLDEPTGASGLQGEPRPTILRSVEDDEDPELVENNDGTKVGGYPQLVRGPIDWGVDDVTFVMQIDGNNPLRLGLGVDGMLYIGYRQESGTWHIAHQVR